MDKEKKEKLKNVAHKTGLFMRIVWVVLGALIVVGIIALFVKLGTTLHTDFLKFFG